MSSPALYKLTAVAHTDHPGTPGEGRRTRNSKTILLRCITSPRVSWYPANLAWKRKRKQGNKLLRKTRGLSRRKGKKNLRTRGWREPEQRNCRLCVAEPPGSGTHSCWGRLHTSRTTDQSTVEPGESHHVRFRLGGCRNSSQKASERQTRRLSLERAHWEPGVEGGRVLDFSLFILEFCGFAFIQF